jgi:phosphoglycolate phosphatase-like HAD superfamily hydrolase
MIKAVIFDFDGVIHDNFEFMFNISKKIRPDLTLEEYRSWFDGNVYDYPTIEPKETRQVFELANKGFKEFVIDPEIKKVLLEISESFKLFIISSNKEEILTDYLQRNGVDHLFSQVFGKETHYSKEVKFKMLLEKHDLHKEDCIFITDTLGDLREANNAGIKSIAIESGFHGRNRLEKGNPLRIVSSFNEILPLLNKTFL